MMLRVDEYISGRQKPATIPCCNDVWFKSMKVGSILAVDDFEKREDCCVLSSCKHLKAMSRQKSELPFDIDESKNKDKLKLNSVFTQKRKHNRKSKIINGRSKANREKKQWRS